VDEDVVDVEVDEDVDEDVEEGVTTSEVEDGSAEDGGITVGLSICRSTCFP